MRGVTVASNNGRVRRLPGAGRRLLGVIDGDARRARGLVPCARGARRVQTCSHARVSARSVALRSRRIRSTSRPVLGPGG